MWEKKAPTKQPHWTQPGSSQTTQINSASRQSQYQNQYGTQGQECIESFSISEMFTLVRIPGDEYYGEFHGSQLPDEVILGDHCSIPVFLTNQR